jgi:hypothetical protein
VLVVPFAVDAALSGGGAWRARMRRGALDLALPVAVPDRARIRSRRRVLGRDAATIGVQTAGACPAALSPRARAAC